jgi:hypothetical protein
MKKGDSDQVAYEEVYEKTGMKQMALGEWE